MFLHTVSTYAVELPRGLKNAETYACLEMVDRFHAAWSQPEYGW